MAWASGRGTNHNPRVVVNGEAGTAPITVITAAGTPIVLDAAGTTDPDGHALAYRWFFYPEAGTGIPGEPVLSARPPVGGGGDAATGGIPSAPEGGPPQPPVRVKHRRRDVAARHRHAAGAGDRARDPRSHRQRHTAPDQLSPRHPAQPGARGGRGFAVACIEDHSC